MLRSLGGAIGTAAFATNGNRQDVDGFGFLFQRSPNPWPGNTHQGGVQ